MGFHEEIERIAAEVPGLEAISVMGYDGLAIDTIAAPGHEGFDLPVFMIEMTKTLATLRESLGALEQGELVEFTFSTAERSTLIRGVNAEYYLAAAFKGPAVPGKARFMARAAAPRVAIDL